MAIKREEKGFIIKEFEHTTAEQVESAVDEILEARGTDIEGEPFNNLNSRINYIESEMRRFRPNVVAISQLGYNQLSSNARRSNILYVIVEDVNETSSGLSISGEISPEVIAEIESLGGVIANGELD